MLYIEATNTVITDPTQRYIHPDTGEVYGGADYGDAAKIAQIGAVPLRVVTPTEGLEVVEWLVEDDPENAGGKSLRPVMLYVQQPDAGFDAATWEIVDDPAHPGDKLKRPATTTPWVITPADLAAKVNAVFQERTRRLELLTVVYNGWTIMADSRANANLTSIVSAMTAGVPIGASFPWPDSSGVVQTLTPTQLVELGGVMLQATLALYQKSWALNAALAAITDPVAFRALDVSAEMYWA
jgi:hypothetical protein